MNRRSLLGAAAAAVVVVTLPWPTSASGATSVTPSRLAVLTPREWQVALLMARGWSNQEIAREFGIFRRTADVHIWRIVQKLEVGNRSEAVGLVRREQRHGRIARGGHAQGPLVAASAS